MAESIAKNKNESGGFLAMMNGIMQDVCFSKKLFKNFIKYNNKSCLKF